MACRQRTTRSRRLLKNGSAPTSSASSRCRLGTYPVRAILGQIPEPHIAVMLTVMAAMMVLPMIMTR